ncbi:MAG: HAD-IIIA family hydrolase [Chitinophagaceae bacterium]
MQISEAIILAGGLGSRLHSVVNDVPKSMASVAGRSFISYVIDYLQTQGIQKFIFSLGYKSGVIDKYLSDNYSTLNYSCVIEDEPLGTGGAVLLACKNASTKNILVTNGDTLFKIDLANLESAHESNDAHCTLALKPMENFDRYGAVKLDAKGRISSFKEKQFYKSGLVNGGVYILNRDEFLQHDFHPKFSFEKDYLEKYYTSGRIFGYVQDVYFIDIGVPEDYQKAQQELKQLTLDLNKTDTSWTLFLDRDGVINEERVGQYVLNWQQFIFNSGVLEAFKIFSEKFGRLIIVSNQRGVGKALMSEGDLKNIHDEMQREIEAIGGRIDKIYFCTEVNEQCYLRKPNPGMAFEAKRDFPDIDFTKSIMVGNKPGDMRFGRSAGMFTVFLTTTNADQLFPHLDIDLRFSSLAEFAKALKS